MEALWQLTAEAAPEPRSCRTRSSSVTCILVSDISVPANPSTVVAVSYPNGHAPTFPEKKPVRREVWWTAAASRLRMGTYLLSPPDPPSNGFVLAAHYGYLLVPSAESDAQTLSTRVN